VVDNGDCRTNGLTGEHSVDTEAYNAAWMGLELSCSSEHLADPLHHIVGGQGFRRFAHD
jgi:hypothetical protein